MAGTGAGLTAACALQGGDLEFVAPENFLRGILHMLLSRTVWRKAFIRVSESEEFSSPPFESLFLPLSLSASLYLYGTLL